VLESLKFKGIEAEDGRTGGPQRYEITAEALADLQTAMTDGKALVINSDGNACFE